jgi:tetratricopeptide (TPR) repeat protein
VKTGPQPGPRLPAAGEEERGRLGGARPPPGAERKAPRGPRRLRRGARGVSRQPGAPPGRGTAPRRPQALRGGGRSAVEGGRAEEQRRRGALLPRLAQAALGETQKARFAWDQAATLPGGGPRRSSSSPGSPPARGQVLNLLMRLVQQALAASPGMIRAGGMEVACSAARVRLEEARARLAHWRSVDPPSSFLRHESALLGEADEALWAHLAGTRSGSSSWPWTTWRSASGTTPTRCSRAAIPRPASWPSRGRPCRRTTRWSPTTAATAPRRRVAPAERTSPSLRASPPATSSRTAPSRRASSAGRSEVEPGDATAHFLLGSLFLAGGQIDEALAEWERARLFGPRLPVLHRNIGFTLLYARGDAAGALRVFEEGMSADPGNVELYEGADQALSLLGRPPEERTAVAPLPGIPLPSRRSCTSSPSPSPRPGASPRRRRSSPGASSPARSSGPTCARSTSR